MKQLPEPYATARGVEAAIKDAAQSRPQAWTRL